MVMPVRTITGPCGRTGLPGSVGDRSCCGLARTPARWRPGARRRRGQRLRTGNWNLYYRLAAENWGYGYATELGRAALDAAHACDNSVAVVAWILSGHAASQHVAQRLGLVDRGPHVDPSDGVTRNAFTDRDVDLPG